jgi:hypothetical protein
MRYSLHRDARITSKKKDMGSEGVDMIGGEIGLFILKAFFTLAAVGFGFCILVVLFRPKPQASRDRPKCPAKVYEFAQFMQANGYVPGQEAIALQEYTALHEAEWKAKTEMDTIPRPVMVDKSHMQHIRSNEPMAKPGYDQPTALSDGKTVEGDWVELAKEKQVSPIRRS